MDVDAIISSSVKRVTHHSKPQKLKNVLVETAVELNPKMSSLQVLEYIEAHYNKFLSSLIKLQRNFGEEKYFCPFELVHTDYIKGFAIKTKTDSELLIRTREVSPVLQKIHHALLNVKHDKFEILCKKVLDLMKAEGSIRTQQSRDEGVDFWGWLKIPESFHHKNEFKWYKSDFRFLVIGQAKKYKKGNKIGPKDIRELIGTVSSLHNDQLSPWDSKFKIDNYKLMTPILPLLISTGYFTRGAKEIAKKSGVILKSGEETSLFLALEGIGMRKKQDGTPWFVKKDFNKWLES